MILAGFVGLRTGELLGLRWCDVDLAGRRLTVLVQAQQVVGMGRIVTGLKSEAGQRTVSLPTVAVDALEKHRADFGKPGGDGVLFTGPRGEPITRAQLSLEWRAARAAAGAPEGLRVHDLRHHAATLAARMPGITTKELMARIGHASPRTALIYQHATEQRDREIARLPRRRDHRSMKFREVVKLLEDDGWFFVRQRGSHRHFEHPTKAGGITVPGNLGEELKPGTLASILRQAGLKGRR